MELLPATIDKYIKDSAINCIVCGSMNGEARNDESNLIETIACLDCGSTWENHLSITSISHLNIPSDKIIYIKGDATKLPFEPAMIAHIVNDQGGWGAGFSGALTKQFGSGPKDHYKKIQREQASQGRRHGYCALYKGPGPIIMHMFAQRGYASTDNPHPLNLDDLNTCLGILYRSAVERELTVHMPRIGTGYGGGTWDEVESLINKHRGTVTTFVYSL